MANLGQPIRIKFIPAIAHSLTRQRPVSERPLKPPGRNWPKAFEKRHPELQARRDKAIDWDRHKKNIYGKTTHWFEVIGNVLRDPAILAENVYNMDETGVMLSMLGSVKVLVGKDDPGYCRGARVKRTTITAIECISADGRYLNPMIIWPATTHRSNWTTFPTPGWQYACTESGYNNSKISYEWLQRIFDPETKERANGRPRLLICDGFRSHQTLEPPENQDGKHDQDSRNVFRDMEAGEKSTQGFVSVTGNTFSVTRAKVAAGALQLAGQMEDTTVQQVSEDHRVRNVGQQSDGSTQKEAEGLALKFLQTYGAGRVM